MTDNGKDPTAGKLTVLPDIPGRVEGEDLFRDGEALFRMLTEAIEEVFWLADVELTTMYYISPSYERIWGRTRRSLYDDPKSFGDAIHPDDKARVFADLAVEKTGQPFSHEYRIIRPDGSVRWIWDRGFPVRSENGQVTRYAGVASDITVRRQATERLEKINACLLGLGPDHAANTQRLTALCGELLNATCALYNRLEGDQLYSHGRWRTPLDYVTQDRADGHICHDVIRQGGTNPLVVRNLPVTLYAITDPNVTKYGLRTYFGQAVHCAGKPLGALCAVFQRDLEPTDDDRRVLGIIAASLGREEERRAAEEAVRASDALYRLLLDNLPMGMFIVDPLTRRIEKVNGRAAAMFGTGEEQIVGHICHEFVCPAEEKQCPVLDLGQSVNDSERVLLRADGRRAPILKSVNTIKWQGRDKLLECFVDITDRKRAEEGLRASEEKYRSLVEEIPLGIYRNTGGPRGRFLFVNSAMAWMFGYLTVEEFMQVEVADLYRDPAERAQFIALLERDGAVENHELDLCRKDGTPIRARLSARTTCGADGEILWIDGIIEDITVQRQLARQLQQAQKMEVVGRLAGGIAHDFNNILCVIRNNAELGLEGLEPRQPEYEFFDEIRIAAKRSAEMVGQLMAFSRKQVIKPRVIELNRLIGENLKMLRRLIGEDITVTFQPEAGLWRLRLDPGQFSQVMTNLAVNSRDAIAGIGGITIATANAVMDAAACREYKGMSPGEYVRFTFSDTGMGMEPETVQRVFDPFFTTKAGKGLGLGLATVYGIVKQNSGAVYAASEPGRGTTITLYLPRVKAAAEMAAESGTAGEVRPGSETVLVVDDEEKIIKVVRKNLERRGYTVLTAVTAEAACRLAAEYPGTIHLLLSDVVMPEMNGRELAAKITAARPAIITLFMSGHTTGLLARRGALDAGVALIEKPFSNETLLRTIRAILDGEGN